MRSLTLQHEHTSRNEVQKFDNWQYITLNKIEQDLWNFHKGTDMSKVDRNKKAVRTIQMCVLWAEKQIGAPSIPSWSDIR